MCLAIPAQVVSIDGQTAVVEMAGGRRLEANLALLPDTPVGAHVLLDRGLVVEVIAAEDAAAVLAIYTEIERAFAEEKPDE